MLRRGISCTDAYCGLHGIAKRQRNIEINQTNISIFRKHYIGRLDITVNNGRILAMQIGNRSSQLFCPFKHLLWFKRSMLLNSILQIRSPDIVHYCIDCIICLDKIINSWQTGMLQSFQDICFLTIVYTIDNLILYFFNYYIRIQSSVSGSVYNASAAGTNLLQYFICIG